MYGMDKAEVAATFPALAALKRHPGPTQLDTRYYPCRFLTLPEQGKTGALLITESDG
jgi:hypothetical protein